MRSFFSFNRFLSDPGSLNAEIHVWADLVLSRTPNRLKPSFARPIPRNMLGWLSFEKMFKAFRDTGSIFIYL